jgi:hypothetical protein
MKTKLLSLLVVLLAAPNAFSQIYLNEIFVSPPGDDSPNEYIELRGPAGSAMPAKFGYH